MCEAAKCEVCAGPEAVRKKAARYEPGGVLWALKQNQDQSKANAKASEATEDLE